MGRRRAASVLAAALVATSLAPVLATEHERAAVRVNQVGYLEGEQKRAYLMANVDASAATFRVTDAGGGTALTGTVGARLGSWNATYVNVYAIDLSALDAPGTYTLVVEGPISAASLPFTVGDPATLYTLLLANAVRFFAAQRDGPDVDTTILDRQPAHLNDARAKVFRIPTYDSDDVLLSDLDRIGGPVDVSGGWFDSGDYMKFLSTASYTLVAMLVGARDHPLLRAGDTDVLPEAAFGLDWLDEMWDSDGGTLYFQVGLVSGNDEIAGDHDAGWRLPEDDDGAADERDDPLWFIAHRPVFRDRAPGKPVSPNLAGRTAAAFALCFQVFGGTDPARAGACLADAQALFDQARVSDVGTLRGATPMTIYPERTWRDDMELAAAQLALALQAGGLPDGLPHTDPAYYLRRGARWAAKTLARANAPYEHLYVDQTASLAHAELARAIEAAGDPPLDVDRRDLRRGVRRLLDASTWQAETDPFGLGWGYDWLATPPTAVAIAYEARLFGDMGGDERFADMARAQLDWVLGANPWGASFITGAGTTFQRCLHHQVANLNGSLDRSPPILPGALTFGPTVASDYAGVDLPEGARPCPEDGSNPFAGFNGGGVRYRDEVELWASVEPDIVYTAPTLLLFARLAEGS